MTGRTTPYGRAARLLQALSAAALALFATPALAADKLVLAFGDSLTAGYGLSPAQAFPTRLEAALRASGKPARVYNAGVSGDTTAAGRARLAWVLRGLKAKPDLAIVELGANDMLRGLKPAQTRANLDAILAEFSRRKIPVLVAGMRAAPNMGRPYAAAFEPIFPLLARKYRAPLYPFFLDGVAGNRTLLQADGMHPNARGVTVIVRRMLPAVRAALR
ncbi:arylesterase [Sphingomonas prati]|uniref:Acyl-CoA thioesterase-1 n=1 Tax=Sphingomonas prati TaxID=1843237 RepID=A0A7W9BPL9_9SPHN|nr:arylesterase [Sphingomonas prati]MBB5727690.1 acyl-CoA thioesterase-1 [Sphingomonas prati]GGE79915.1 arylesterase [Sphingomonas prati]